MRTADDYYRDVIPRVFLPVLRELLTPEEFATVDVSIRRWSDDWEGGVVSPLSPDIVLGVDDWSLHVEVWGEPMREWILEPAADDPDFGHWTDTMRAERFYSNLQDFISESTFGWGQLRGHM